MGVFEADLRVLAHQRGRQGTQLGEHLDTREATTDDDDGQQTVALGAAGSEAALSKFDMTLSRIATASSIVFSPIALSAIPGIGKVRETAPAVTTIWSYANSYGLADGRRDRRDLLCVVDVRHLGGEDVGALR